MELFELTMDNGMPHYDEKIRHGLIVAKDLKDARVLGFQELVKWSQDLEDGEQQGSYSERVSVQNPTETEAGFEVWADWEDGKCVGEKRCEYWSGMSTREIYWFSVTKATTLNGYAIESVVVKKAE